METDRLRMNSAQAGLNRRRQLRGASSRVQQSRPPLSPAAASLLEWVHAALAASGDPEEPLYCSLEGLRGCFEDSARALRAVVQHYEPGLLPAEALASFPWAADEPPGHISEDEGAFAALNTAVDALGESLHPSALLCPSLLFSVCSAMLYPSFSFSPSLLCAVPVRHRLLLVH